MLSKLHKKYFRLLIVVRMFLILSMVFGIYVAIAQSEPVATPTKDYNWLVRLCTEQALRQNVYDNDVADADKAAAMNELTKGLDATQKANVEGFVKFTKVEPYYSALIRLNGYICKRWPCPPPPIEPSKIVWLVPSIREADLRNDLHLHAVRGLRNISGNVVRPGSDIERSRKDLLEFKSLGHHRFPNLTDQELDDLLEFFSFQENWILLGRIGDACIQTKACD